MKQTDLHNNWKDITLKEYLKYVEFTLKLNKDDLEYSYKLLAFLEKVSLEEIKSKPIVMVNILLDKYSYLSQDIFNTETSLDSLSLEILGEFYPIQKDFQMLTFEMWQNIDEILKQSSSDNNYLKNINLLLAIASYPKETYNYDKAMLHANYIINMKMYDLIPNISFFFTKEDKSLKTTLLSLKEQKENMIQEMDLMLNKISYSAKLGVGMSLWSILQTKIYVSLVRYYIRIFKRY